MKSIVRKVKCDACSIEQSEESGSLFGMESQIFHNMITVSLPSRDTLAKWNRPTFEFCSTACLMKWAVEEKILVDSLPKGV